LVGGNHGQQVGQRLLGLGEQQPLALLLLLFSSPLWNFRCVARLRKFSQYLGYFLLALLAHSLQLARLFVLFFAHVSQFRFQLPVSSIQD